MGFLRRILVGLTLAALSFGGVAVAVWLVADAVRESMAEDSAPAYSREIVRSVNVVPFVTGPARPVLQVYGEVLARRQLELRATTAGRVVELAPEFQDGGTVRAGQLLARIDPVPLEADLRVAQADLAEAEADLRDAERALVLAREDLAAAEEQYMLRRQALTRQEDLVARGVGTAALVEEAALSASSARQAVVSRRQALATAEARIDQASTTRTRAEIAVSEASRALAETEMRAGFTGTLSEVSLVEGGLVNANEKIATMIDPAALEVSFRISTAQHARLLDGQGRLIGLPVAVTLEVAGLDLTAHGVIDRESAIVGEGQTGRQVYARLDSAPALRPGDFVTLRIEEPPLNDIATLPASALGADGAILVLGAEDRLETVAVTLARRQDNSVLVSGPPELEGRLVVAERTPLLGSGLKVRPVSRDDAAPAPRTQAMLRLDPDRRARLVAYVEGNARMPGDMKTRILGQLAADEVPAQVVERLESRMGS